ncbi:FN3 associated domain-containing protein [Ammonifex thiophilus]|uniref:FN3 associated domain-containing protein n=1 Tax=Ammonifex thiophilus TaxID=444093 RepID=UPI001402A52A|nr:FN3 associated domain-containing protein [Ammonifex thiophilus]
MPRHYLIPALLLVFCFAPLLLLKVPACNAYSVTRTVYRDEISPTSRLNFSVGREVYLDLHQGCFPRGIEKLTFTVTSLSGIPGVSFAVYLDTGGVPLPSPARLGLPAGDKQLLLCRGERGWYRVAAGREGQHLFVEVSGSGVWGVAESVYLPAPPVERVEGGRLCLEGDGEIWYTTDGSDPRLSPSAVRFERPIELSAPAASKLPPVIKAAALKDGYWSEMAAFVTPEPGSGYPRPSGSRILATTAATISPEEGGTLELPGVARLAVPPGALPARGPVLMRLVAVEAPANLPGGNEAVTPAVWLRCRGLCSPFFNRPVTLTFAVLAGNEAGLRILSLDGEGGTPEEALPGGAEGGELRVQVTHTGRFVVVKDS